MVDHWLQVTASVESDKGIEILVFTVGNLE